MAYTNPSSIIRFSSRKGGRASIYENNAQYQQHSTGVFSGSGVTQNTSADMNVIVGGAFGTSGSNGYIPAASPANPNILIGKNANGYKIMLDVVGTTLLQITKPAQNSRISLVVAYTDDLSIQSTETSDTGNPAKNGIIVVNGQPLANPVPPSDSDIRTAITADGAAGSQAVYAIIARITVASNTTTITNTMIAVDNATIPGSAISSLLASRVIMPSASNGGADLGTAYTRNFNAPYLQYGVLTRIGNVVHLSVSYNGNGVSAGAGTSHPAESIPYGYRPTTSQRVVGVLSTSSLNGTWLWKINGATTGTGPATTDALITSAGFGAGQNEVYGSAFWITADPITPVLGDSKIALS